jgi:cyanophycinase
MLVVLIGGGTEIEGDWSDPLFAALGEGRNVAILGAQPSDEPGWYEAYFLSLGALSAEEFVLASAAEAAAADLTGFDAFFLRGGDQWDYASVWAGTPVEEAILGAAAVGGTSAGAMVLGELDYTAEDGGIAPENVLLGVAATLDDAFLPLLPGVLVDTHFGQRGRLGRLAPWAACEGVTGVGIDDMTGAVVQDGVWTVHGTGTVSFLEGGSGSCDGAPSVTGQSLDVLTEGWTWDGGATGPGTARDATLVLSDATLADGTEGTVSFTHVDPDALYCGTLELFPGTSAVAGIVSAGAFDEETVEPRVAGVPWALAQAGLPFGAILPEGVTIETTVAGTAAATGPASAVVLVAEGGTVGDERGWQDGDCTNPRLARALTGAQVTVLAPGGEPVSLAAAAPADTGDTGGHTGVPPELCPASEDCDDGRACGCGTTGAAVGWWFLPLFAGRRRAFGATRRSGARGSARAV